MNTFNIHEDERHITYVLKLRCTFFPLLSWQINGVWQHAVGDCVAKQNLASICDRMVLNSVDNLWKCKYGSELTIFSALAIFPSSIFQAVRQFHFLPRNNAYQTAGEEVMQLMLLDILYVPSDKRQDTGRQNTRKRGHTWMPRVEFEAMIKQQADKSLNYQGKRAGTSVLGQNYDAFARYFLLAAINLRNWPLLYYVYEWCAWIACN
jgi:hypothetical protein